MVCGKFIFLPGINKIHFWPLNKIILVRGVTIFPVSCAALEAFLQRAFYNAPIEELRFPGH